MALGCEDEETACFQHFRLFGFNLGSNARNSCIAFGPFGHFTQFVFSSEFKVTAQFDVGTTTRHVGGDGYRAQTTGLRHDMCFLFVEPGIEDGVLHAFLVQIFG